MSGKNNLSYNDILSEVKKWDYQKLATHADDFVRKWKSQHPNAKKRDYPELVKRVDEGDLFRAEDVARAYNKYRNYLPAALKKKATSHILDLPTEQIKIIRIPKSTSLSTGPAITKKKTAGRRNIKIDSAVKAHTKSAYNELCSNLFNSNTVASLKVIAAANGLTGFSKMNKAELCEAIAQIKY